MGVGVKLRASEASVGRSSREEPVFLWDPNELDTIHLVISTDKGAAYSSCCDIVKEREYQVLIPSAMLLINEIADRRVFVQRSRDGWRGYDVVATCH